MKNLSTKTKSLYGLGFASLGIKDGLFQLFLFFYYSQVLGLDAALTGTSTLIALAFDAISDPLIGVLSDNWKSKKWGRRHPFMLASTFPMGVFTYLLFLPPEGLGQTGLFWWMTGFAILLRTALTLFIIPAMSLGAEMSEDFEERTSITSYRVTFASVISPVVIAFGLLTFFTPTEGMSNGLFNAAAYPKFALLCGILMMLVVLISAWGTRGLIPSLPQKSDTKESFFQIFNEFLQALSLPSYRVLLGYSMWIYVGFGIGVSFTTYYTTYYFGLSEKELALLPIGAFIGGILSLFMGPYLGRKLDKKWATMISTIVFGLFFSLPFLLRRWGMFPDNDSPNLLPAYIGSLVVAYTFLFICLSLASSMMADVVDDYELHTGRRQEGLFFSTLSFAHKCTIGIGFFVAGFLLNWIAFPKQTEVADVPKEAIEGLGLIGGPIAFVIYLSGIFFLFFYPITKERYLEIRQALEQI